MICLECKHEKTLVYYTKQNENIPIVIRKRKCEKCKLRFTTHEKSIAESFSTDSIKDIVR